MSPMVFWTVLAVFKKTGETLQAGERLVIGSSHLWQPLCSPATLTLGSHAVIVVVYLVGNVGLGCPLAAVLVDNDV